ncbi:DNA sulfur modification protein DndD [Parabacteroides sp. AD58]|uniref:DNA sulfur modification protein DndD n=1 Tax=Parabacteroides absconsus TaxID=2951805 RepID=A0ABZ2IRL9_9BACT|nr:DNA sulfur modification protein DndD [Parabacteroides sp. AD58]MCM6903349.1 DNA sulfur modification protein DndD [Parabacteroides sp. AD58]
MFINSIILKNYRSYKGINKVTFKDGTKNVYLIAGNNGFGKTTFLTSLVWCFYGKLMVDVDERFRREINDAQGYKNYARMNLNKQLIPEVSKLNITSEEKKFLQKNGYVGKYEDLQDETQYSVEINLSDVFIPSIPCREIRIKRTYDLLLENETIEVLIDEQTNELAKEVGYDIFINDFILSKDIAKFFFFDAEKIVNLAETKSVEEKKRLSIAYSEVLGIKKYEDIKRNLENLRIKFRKVSGINISEKKLDKMTDEVESLEKEITILEQLREEKELLLTQYRHEKDSLQVQLIREGNAMSIEDLNKKKELLNTLKAKVETLKNDLKDMLDLAPFAISGKLLYSLYEQVNSEDKIKNGLKDADAINASLNKIYSTIIDKLNKINLSENQSRKVRQILDDSLSECECKDEVESEKVQGKILLDFNQIESRDFNALFDNIRYSFNSTFKQLVREIKTTNNFIVKTQKIVSAAEYDNKDIQIKEIREKKALVESNIVYLEKEIRSISEKFGVKNKELTIKKKNLSEVLKAIKIEGYEKEKDEIAERLIKEITLFLNKLKEKRKNSIEMKLKAAIASLMHKSDFIKDVRVDLLSDTIEINLLDDKGQNIKKDKLSKGEQQLYATSILKALVDESGIDFPIFIDSPLQKFDSIHSKNVIKKFYPNIARQVVIFPLLGKELSYSEYELLYPYINKTYCIINKNGVSMINEVEPLNLFDYITK